MLLGMLMDSRRRQGWLANRSSEWQGRAHLRRYAATVGNLRALTGERRMVDLTGIEPVTS